MACTRRDQVMAAAEGSVIEIEGRYQPAHVDMRPSGEAPVTVQVVLADGFRVLLGGYATPECVRPAEERERLTGVQVRVVGTFRPTAPYPGGGPMPGLWTGGGPQLVAIVSLSVV